MAALWTCKNQNAKHFENTVFLKQLEEVVAIIRIIHLTRLVVADLTRSLAVEIRFQISVTCELRVILRQLVPFHNHLSNFKEAFRIQVHM